LATLGPPSRTGPFRDGAVPIRLRRSAGTRTLCTVWTMSSFMLSADSKLLYRRLSDNFPSFAQNSNCSAESARSVLPSKGRPAQGKRAPYAAKPARGSAGKRIVSVPLAASWHPHGKFAAWKRRRICSITGACIVFKPALLKPMYQRINNLDQKPCIRLVIRTVQNIASYSLPASNRPCRIGGQFGASKSRREKIELSAEKLKLSAA
jgi:hypothetical protein